MSEQQPPFPPPAGPPSAPPSGPPSAPPSGPPVYPAFAPRGPGWNGPPPSNTMAIVALVLSFIPLGITWIAAIVLACIVLSRVGKGQARGRGMAIAALIISALWVAAVVALVVVGVQEDKKQDKARDEGTGEISVTRTRTGDCLVTIPGSTKVTTVDIVPCAEPHLGEVFATFNLDLDGDASQDAIDRLAEGGCVSRFPAYVGGTYAKSKLEVAYLRPIKGTLAIDDGVTCILASTEKSSGSLKGSKR